MTRDVEEVPTPDRLWRARINAWKTDVLFFHEVGASVLVEKQVYGRWTKTLGSTIHLRVSLVGLTAARVFQVSDMTYSNAGYRDWRVRHYGVVLNFGVNGIKLPSPIDGVTVPESSEKVRAVRASGYVAIPGYTQLVLPEVCSGELCG